MSKNTVWPVTTQTVGRAHAGTVVFRSAGQLRVTAIVKAAFAFSREGRMTEVDCDELRAKEAHHGDNPTRSLRACGELSPYKRQADVVFIGHAHAPGGAPVASLQARLAVIRGASVALDKRIEIVGDRAEAAGAPTPFAKLPILYERAFGGIGFPDNPIGVGIDRKKPPNIVFPSGARPNEPAGFGPISWAWTARKSLLGSMSRKALDRPIIELAADFDDRFFQIAPADQRIDRFAGDERVVLGNLNRAAPTLEIALPRARGLARAWDAAGRTLELELTLDTLSIDGDAEVLTMLWRGSFSIPDEEALAGLRVVAGLELAGKTIAWPDLGAAKPARARPAASSPVEEKLSRTMAIDDVDIEEVPQGRGLGGTLMLDPPDQPPEESPFESTLELGAGDHGAAAAAAALPFVGKPAGAGDAAPAREIPGAPWASKGAPRVTRPRADLSGTMHDEAPASVAKARSRRPPPPAPFEAPVPEAPVAPDRAPIAADPWKKPDDPAPTPPPERRAPAPPKSTVSKSLYKGFGKG